MSREALAQKLFVSVSLVAAWENGRRIPKPQYVEELDKLYKTDGILSRLLEKLVSAEVSPQWLGRWLDIEAGASQILVYQPSIIPGLFQTEEYARAIMRPSTQPPFDVEEQVTARLERQKILNKDQPPLIVSVLDESVLCRVVGGYKVMAEQLNHLLTLTERPDIMIQVTPHDVGAYSGFGYPLEIASFNDTDYAYLDDALKGQVVEQPNEVKQVRRIWERLRAAALSERASLKLIGEKADEMARVE